jgi:dTDP-4-dehydrorhamnose reductase
MSREALIIGSSGFVAPALGHRLREAGWQVRHASRTGEIRLDLAKLDMSILPQDADAVFLIAAATALRRCEDDPHATGIINVEAPAEIARFYAGKGAHVVMISTNLVFDGRKPTVPGTSFRRPDCVYGQQKAELEDALLALSGPATVLRITKIVESLRQLIANWSDDLAAGRPIRPFIDLVCAPVSLNRVVDILVHAARQRSAGVFQHSGDRDIGYAEIARVLCRRMKVSDMLVEPVKGADLPVPPVALPRHTTLAEYLPSGFAPNEPEDSSAVLGEFFDGYGALTKP